MNGISVPRPTQSTPIQYRREPSGVRTPEGDISRARERHPPYRGGPCPIPGCDGTVIMGRGGHGTQLRCLCGWEEEAR